MSKSSREILESARVIAVVGASRDPRKPSAAVPLTLKAHGFRIIPVNPSVTELFGERCYPSLEAIPDKVDIVDVFRPSEDTPPIARSAVAIGAKALWLQQGIRSDEARRIAEAGGLDYVEDECTAVVRALAQITKR